ncbi:assimilatory sulfite reductase (NADPH) flavoprotein subunit [Halobacillus shinanisalinarum]|uniref:Assimilatory sulfite reductase (NADPH) flavoprotein subunit n=1 Tax=Halobacillus shinanisalinarum TaxID=2932258 RepID=A0ABY4GZ05_9BACI|nr:assimilatory sulfite reductase (NADPH) flavoprotein subunit [Halobacillus shinanisalinarum]UOQ93138.1 assimilatory sulfite reductase (NADPH) flavoprotein subunit [Halobacillus shinanisalinarum]
MQFQVMNSPFKQEQAELLNQVLPTMTENQKIWLSGYLASSQSTASTATADPAVQNALEPEAFSQNAVQNTTREVTILFGSHTGNCEALAGEMSQKLEQQDYKVTLSMMDDFKPKALKKVEDLLILTSTHGDGDPPDNAMAFYDFLHSKRAPELEDLRYSVLALGDSSYEFYCQTGKEFDKRLEELGGKRIYPRVDCDLDFEEPAEEWVEGVLATLNNSKEVNREDERASQSERPDASTNQPAYSRTNPFKAEILENLNLNGRGSNKETRHLELDLEGSDLEFEPGDSLGIFPENDSVLVNQLIEVMKWDPEDLVPVNKQGELRPLREALTSTFEITGLTKPLLEKVAQLSANEELNKLIVDQEELKAYLYGRDLIDLVQDFGLRDVPAEEFIKILRKIPPRLYSIASSLQANPDEVHLTIGALRYDAHGRERTGVCSGQCTERSQPGDVLSVFIQRNSNFKLPENLDTPVIMIGAGTGVAPYRAFLEEREEINAEGDTWLFFGEQHFVTDFLYQVEWQKWLKEGVLSRADVAFSRDTSEKVYVQHRMLEKSRDLYQWLQEGAAVYVCGDEKYMAKDVETTLLTILEQEGNMSQEEAEAYLVEMRKQKRYQRDVY